MLEEIIITEQVKSAPRRRGMNVLVLSAYHQNAVCPSQEGDECLPSLVSGTDMMSAPRRRGMNADVLSFGGADYVCPSQEGDE